MLLVAQLPLLKARWKQVLFGAVFQYFHGVSTQLAHRMHRPQEDILHDVGFELLPVRGCEGCREFICGFMLVLLG